jgi:hypothetical protein
MTRSEFTVADAHSYDHRSTLRWLQAHILRYPALGLTFCLTTVGMASSQSMMVESLPHFSYTWRQYDTYP